MDEFEKELKEAQRCVSFLSKLKGFMFSWSKKPKLFVFNNEEKVQLHTFFCFFPLKIIYLDRNFKKIKEEIAKPFRLLEPCQVKYILEIPLK